MKKKPLAIFAGGLIVAFLLSPVTGSIVIAATSTPPATFTPYATQPGQAFPTAIPLCTSIPEATYTPAFEIPTFTIETATQPPEYYMTQQPYCQTAIAGGGATPESCYSVFPTATATMTQTPTATPTDAMSSCNSAFTLSGDIIYPSFYESVKQSSTLTCEQPATGIIWCHGQVIYVDNSDSGDYGAIAIVVPVSGIVGGTAVTIKDRSEAAGGFEWDLYGRYTYHMFATLSGYPDGYCSGSFIWRLDGEYTCNSSSVADVLLYAFCSGVSGTLCINNYDYTFSLVNLPQCLSTPIPSTATPPPSGGGCIDPNTIQPDTYINSPSIRSGGCSWISEPRDITPPDWTGLDPIHIPGAGVCWKFLSFDGKVFNIPLMDIASIPLWIVSIAFIVMLISPRKGG